MEQNKDKAICRCKKVYYQDIEQAVANGETTFEEVQEATKIAKGCGRCKAFAEEITTHILKSTIA